MLAALVSDIRVALRSMRRQPLFALVVVATLALGIGANTAMFGLLHAALVQPLPYPESERLVLARTTFAGRPNWTSSAPDYYDYQQQTPGFESLAAAYGSAGQQTILGGSRPEHVRTLLVSHDLFRTLGVPPLAGRSFSAEEGRKGGPPVAMIGEALAKRRFGSVSAALGRSLSITGVAATPVAATIVGVVPASFHFIDDVEMWLPMLRGQGDGPETRGFHNWAMVGRLRHGVSIDEAQRQANVVARRLEQEYPKTNRKKGLQLDPLQQALLGTQASMLFILMGAVGLVLLIACANVAGLLVARGVTRRSELAIRGALGASRWRIVALLTTESVLFSVIAGIAGALLAVWLRRVLGVATGLAASGIAARAATAPVLLFAASASLVTGLLSGAVPAIRASSLRLSEHLAPGVRATDSKGGARLRSLLVVGQVALSLVLLAGAGLLIRSLARLASTELGFDSRGLLVATIDSPSQDRKASIQFQVRLMDELAAIPGVTGVALTTHVPIRNPGSDPPMWAAQRPPVDASDQRTALRRVVTPGYFKTLGIPLLAGRDLAATDREGTPRVMVIDETMAREFFPGENPIGQRVVGLAMGGAEPGPLDFEVVGIVGTARLNGPSREPMSTVYLSAYQFGMARAAVFRTALPPAALTETLRRLMARQHPDVPVDALVSMDDIVDRSLVSRRMMAVMLASFSGAALLLAALGLYGVLAFYVTQRQHEIGVRVALGAGTLTILRQVLSRSAAMVGPGLALGLLAALAAGRLIRQFLYQTEPTDAMTLSMVTGGLALVAFAASAWPALRAARVDPMRALRSE